MPLYAGRLLTNVSKGSNLLGLEIFSGTDTYLDFGRDMALKLNDETLVKQFFLPVADFAVAYNFLSVFNEFRGIDSKNILLDSI